MKITTAWAQQLDEQGRPPWLLSAYDEYTFDEWNGVPDFYTADVAKSSGPDVEVREIVIVVPDSAIRDAFKTPVAQAKVIS